MGQLMAASQNTINLTGAQSSNPWTGLSTITLDDLDFSNQSHVKKYQVLEIEEDLLALSCAWQRLRQGYADGSIAYSPIEKLTDRKLFEQITQCDHDKAASIRDYYSKKIVMWKLKGIKLTKFREDMNAFIHSTGKMFKEDMQPLAYRLPEFYDYDIGFDALVTEYNKKVIQDVRDIVECKQLTTLKTFIVGKKYNKRKEYWFKDENNNLVSMSFVKDNPLIPLMDLHTAKPFSVNAVFIKRDRDNNEYLAATKIKFM